MDKKLEVIRLRGVRQNNLKGWDLELPLGKLIVVTGLSGAGKSSLVFDTLHAEGQRRYVETFSPYVRQFMELLERPRVTSIENIRPSIAIQQSNTVKTSRSTVGTMTELCDYMKVWFCHQAALFDPATGERIDDDNPQTIWHKASAAFPGEEVTTVFRIRKPASFRWKEIVAHLQAQGFQRVFVPAGEHGHRLERLESWLEKDQAEDIQLLVVHDRLRLRETEQSRFLESAATCLHFGQGEMQLFSPDGEWRASYTQGWYSPVSGRKFRVPTPALFSFNSPLGACPHCRGFGRVIEIDYRLVIPDDRLSLRGGAIRAFQGAIYSESLKDLLRACQEKGIAVDVPWRDLPEEHRRFVIEGEPDYHENGKTWPKAWYGVKRFFAWLESSTYKMHVRVFLAKYRAYVNCPHCQGQRLQPEALFWKWQGYTLPQLYQMPISDLLELLRRHPPLSGALPSVAVRQVSALETAYEGILTRLQYLEQVGLGYLHLDRASRTLSGGETERVNLTACLGTSLVDTLFVLDEPSIGLHARDIDRLIAILRRLTAQGNTVVVVEHDESIMRASDWLIEIGPKPGAEGGHLVYAGPVEKLLTSRRLLQRVDGEDRESSFHQSITADYLNGRKTITRTAARRPVHLHLRSRSRGKPTPCLRFFGVSKHNIRDLEVEIPLQRLVVLTGVSGAGKSTLLDNVVYQGLLARAGKATEDPAVIRAIESDLGFSEIVLVDQSPISKTPRSNPALYVEAWDAIRDLLASTEAARAGGWTSACFSFNSGSGRCPACEGLGYERVEMQFMADVYVPCAVCEGRRFQPEVLTIQWNGRSVADILSLNVSEALKFFAGQPKILARLQVLETVGLGYLPLGQPLHTLSGGESQRLKLVKYLARFGDRGRAKGAIAPSAEEEAEPTVSGPVSGGGQPGGALILLDEPTTGLHRDDVCRLIALLHRLVEEGHSLLVIEHQMDVIQQADWIIEMGPEAGAQGGKIVFSGTPEELARSATATSAYLRPDGRYREPEPSAVVGYAAEEASRYGSGQTATALEIIGARQHNLKNLHLRIPHREITVVTGVSGSGKSSLAFDIVFAEGQRRFLESMSAWARQYVEQLPRAEVDRLAGIPPTVAIEQRVTAGTSKSTVATITEVAQYLRLLYARLGVPHSPVTGQPLVAQKPLVLLQKLQAALASAKPSGSWFHLCSPLVRGRKGHHEPLAKWCARQGFTHLRIDGQTIAVKDFQKLDRYKEHDLDVVYRSYRGGAEAEQVQLEDLEAALKLGGGSCLLTRAGGEALAWYSTTRTDPATGESYPELDPKHFSWNSAKGWCPTCRGYGQLFDWMRQDEHFSLDGIDFQDGQSCPACQGTRLQSLARQVRLYLKDGTSLSLPELLRLTPGRLLEVLARMGTDQRSQAILCEVRPEIEERLRFMDQVGLDYLTLDRATATLSGGEAQRIRLAAQLGSNLSGVLYVLDEPSIGLHARDNARLIESLQALKAKGNTLLIVEHDEDTMRAADRIIDLGPGAGRHGGELIAQGHWKELLQMDQSLTGLFLKNGICHPVRGAYRHLPTVKKGRVREKGGAAVPGWLVLEKAALRNLKGFTLQLPLQKLIVVCGVSGAGKSTLIRDLLAPVLAHACSKGVDAVSWLDFAAAGKLWPGQESRPAFYRLSGAAGLKKVVEVDQSPIGKTPRSTPATYIGIFDLIRQFYASLPEAKIAGLKPGAFSFNIEGGRCAKCHGAGQIKLEMAFLPETYVQCDECEGFRYSPALKEIRWKGKNISDVLAMSCEEALEFFDFHQRLRETLGLMVETGLGYLTLGQSSPTLSGGEAQRLKLVSELVAGLPTYQERSRGLPTHNVYILEEPTIGLHLSDCHKLIHLLHRLVDQGHTVIVIEHHLDIIAEADYVVEIGPDGGERGGELLYQGKLAGLLSVMRSPTAPFLRGKVKVEGH